MDSREILTHFMPTDPLEEDGLGPTEDPLSELAIPAVVFIESKSSSRFRNLLLVVSCMAAAAAGFAIMFFVAIYLDARDTAAARREMAILRAMVEDALRQEAMQEYYLANYPVTAEEEIGQYLALTVVPHVSDFDVAMREINPDYVAWLRIGGTSIDHPVVRALDNEKYLEISFFGEPNSHGTLFMDYRNVGDHVPHIIIYGHNTRTGDKFGDLRNFLNAGFLMQNNIITLMVNDRIVEYEIFSARQTDVYDYAYFLDFDYPGSFHAFLERTGAPPYAAQILTLSTCISRGDDDERLVVQAALIMQEQIP